MHYLTVTARDQCGDDGNRCRCELDEFPLDSLREAGVLPQALRMLNGNENGRQGRDYQDWLEAVWEPCSSLLQRPPPITWEIGAIPANDARATSNAIIPKYGVSKSSTR